MSVGAGVLGTLGAPITTTVLMAEKVKEYNREKESGKAIVVGLLTPLASVASIAVPPSAGVAAGMNVHKQLSPTGNLSKEDVQLELNYRDLELTAARNENAEFQSEVEEYYLD